MFNKKSDDFSSSTSSTATTNRKRSIDEDLRVLDDAKRKLEQFDPDNYPGACLEVQDLLESLVGNDQRFQEHFKNLVYFAVRIIDKADFVTTFFPMRDTKQALDLILRIAVLKDNTCLLCELLEYTRELKIKLDLDMVDKSGRRAIDYFFVRYPEEMYGENESSKLSRSRTPISIIRILLEAGANGNSFFDAVKDESSYIAKLDKDNSCNGCLDKWIAELRVKHYKFQEPAVKIESEDKQLPQLVVPPASTLSLCLYGGAEVHFDMTKLSSTAQLRVDQQLKANIAGEISAASLFLSLAKEFASVGVFRQ